MVPIHCGLLLGTLHQNHLEQCTGLTTYESACLHCIMPPIPGIVKLKIIDMVKLNS